ncbi:methionine adenosyltransferase [Thermodesulfobacteriota bacterium]
MRERLFTSESVTEGHPDKICDQISDAILDSYLMADPNAKCAVECMVTGNRLIIAGEVASDAEVDIAEVARQTIRDIGYTDPKMGFSDQCEIRRLIKQQSQALTRNASLDRPGAGDQGLMFGYACDNPDQEYMPLPIYLAHQLAKHMAEIRKNGVAPFLRPDGKTQVTVKWCDDEISIDNIVIASHHSPDIKSDELKGILRNEMMQVIPEQYRNDNFPFHINAAGDFVVGGPAADTGLTGRKIIVDTYGGWARHGGGAFSGKDATKVDRSGNYMARHMAKSVVASALAKECEIQLAYVIGKESPVSVRVDTFGTGAIPEGQIELMLEDNFDLSLAGIIDYLSLRKPEFRQVAAYGHFGRSDLRLAWETTKKLG